MRTFFYIFLLFLPFGTAIADQTDPRLDTLFEELRAGDAIDAELTVSRIRQIWSQSQSETVSILYARAKASVDSGEFELASVLLDHAIGLSPNFAQSFALRGIVRLALAEEDGALDDFSKTLALEPRQFEVHIAIAELLLARQKKDDAYAQYQKALEWNPHDEIARDRARTLLREISSQEI